MLNEIKRVRKFSEGVFASGSRAGTPEEDGNSTIHSTEDDLLIAVIILGIIVFALILVIIYGYYKYVKRGGGDGGEEEKMENEQRDRTSDTREATGDIERPQIIPDNSQISVPVKMRKRSMTFSETDEECRKYREDLADSYDKPGVLDNPEHSRKKSFVTFAGVKEIDGNES